MENKQEMIEEGQIINNSLSTERFNDAYFNLHTHLVENGSTTESRNGKTFELLNFKTEIRSPHMRCVGGSGRNINIFFLLAEALWIWAGRRDVHFLETFNSKIVDFSDDGKTFHAPYGWRLRKYGVDSKFVFDDSNKHALDEGRDQIADCLKMLDMNDTDRRVVAQIWNADLDLGTISKDIPCNDMLMFKVRDNKLHVTIQNRSNDLDWGLCTNVFQFSFILEIMAKILGKGIGHQVHNSQSLHLYEWNALTKGIENSEDKSRLYDNCSTSLIDFNFDGQETVSDKLNVVDFWVKSIITTLIKKIDKIQVEQEELQTFKDNLFLFSENLYFIYSLLEIYVEYKNKDITRYQALKFLKNLNLMQTAYKTDYMTLAMNFFVTRSENSKDMMSAEEAELIQEIRTNINENIGKY